MRTLSILVPVFLIAACSDDGGGTTAPLPPSNLEVSNVSGGGHLTWTDNADNEDEFIIMRKTGTGALVEIDSIPFNGNQYHDESVVAGTAYVYQVVATNAAGDAPSSEVPFTP